MKIYFKEEKADLNRILVWKLEQWKSIKSENFLYSAWGIFQLQEAGTFLAPAPE